MHYNFEVLTRKLLLKGCNQGTNIKLFLELCCSKAWYSNKLLSSFTVQVEIEVLYLNTKVLTGFQNNNPAIGLCKEQPSIWMDALIRKVFWEHQNTSMQGSNTEAY